MRALRLGSLTALVLLAGAGCRRTLPAPEGTFVPADAGGGDQVMIVPSDAASADHASAPDVGGGDPPDALRPPDAAPMCPTNAPTLDVCGCGCCGAPVKNACYYPELGQSIATIPNPPGTDCQFVGCSAGVHNVCCAGPGSPPAAGASYCYDIDRSASGGLDGVCNGNAAELAIGGLGSVAISNGKLDVHVVLFFEVNGTIYSKRIDVDQLDVLCNGAI